MPAIPCFIIARGDDNGVLYLADEERWYQWVKELRQAKRFPTLGEAQAWLPANLPDKCRVCESTY